MKEQKINEFLDRRFGMFIHFGVYSMLGGCYNGKTVGDELGEWVMNVLQIPVADYEKAAAQFRPDQFDAEEIVLLAKRAGMRYIVITTKHHDGFALFHSKADRYNIYDWGGFGRDLVAELAQACKKHDMKLGFYYSQALDWHERHAGGWEKPPSPTRASWANDWDFPDNASKDFSVYFEKKVKPQVCELLTHYGEVFLMWFDTPCTISEAQSQELYELVSGLQPDCLINSRIGNGKGDYASTGDNQIPLSVCSFPVECPVTLNDTWGYKSYDHNWKTSKEILELLKKLASKNVNFLLNIGPMGDGSLSPETSAILSGLSNWMECFQPAIYNTRGCPAGFPWGYATMRENMLYLLVSKGWEQAECNGLTGIVKRVTSLAGHAEIPFRQWQEGGVKRISVSVTGGQVYAVELDRPVSFVDCPVQQCGTILLEPVYAKIDGKSADRTDSARFDEGGAYLTLDDFEWEFAATQAGEYCVELVTGALSDMPEEYRRDCRIALECGGQTLISNLQRDGSYSDSKTEHGNTKIITKSGSFSLSAPGRYRMRLRNQQPFPKDITFFFFYGIRLVRL